MIEEIMMISAVITTVFMTLCFVMDIRERMIYAFPCVMLIPFWLVLGIVATHRAALIGIIFALHMLAYFIFKTARIWGDGDSDVFLLYGTVFMTAVFTGKYEIGIAWYILAELVGIIIALFISLVIGIMEAIIRKKMIEKTSSVAVVPGFSVVIAGLLTKMIIVG